ncbi:MAG: hypothetical protein QNJ46_00240 [Leptolyngbyaceae cyanobacterium MO_188.B28]|nr:hypothetical protein [Leptolyngbyaceae cyanobacterium MO_188.B28]
MNWRGSPTVSDRLLATLPYLLPLTIAVAYFSGPFFSQFPFLFIFFQPLLPLIQILNLPFAIIIIFFALLLLVVRNSSISHFIRFNTMQAILLDIALFICSLLLQLLGIASPSGPIIETLFNVIFLGSVAAVGYSVVQTLMGRYAEIPTISDAVHMQVR